MADSFGMKIRKQRHRLGFTLDVLADMTKISKPYLSLIETNKVNPPREEKVRIIESVLNFTPGELVLEADIVRTPRHMQKMLLELLAKQKGTPADESENLTELVKDHVQDHKHCGCDECQAREQAVKEMRQKLRQLSDWCDLQESAFSHANKV